MTVGAKVKETLASLKGAQATLKQMADLEQHPGSHKILLDNSRRIQQVVQKLESRVGILELEEPQYKGF